VISANGVNLMVDTTGGNLFIRAYGINAGVYQNPHVAPLNAQAPASFRYATATTILPGFTSNIDVANYDPGGLGVVTPIGGGANTSTIHRVFIAGSPVVNEQIIVQYGQTTYASIAAAEAAIGSGSFIVNPAFTGTVTGYVVATRTATDLSDISQARFARAGKFPTLRSRDGQQRRARPLDERQRQQVGYLDQSLEILQREGDPEGSLRIG
jgi:hypothetical protein